MTSNPEQSIKNWTYTLPRNCSPVENFLLAMKTELEILEATQSQVKIHVVLDARQVATISTYNKMKMDAFWKRYDTLIIKYIHYTTLFVDTEKQKQKLDKIYRQSKSKSPYRVILASEMQQHNELSNNTVGIQSVTTTTV